MKLLLVFVITMLSLITCWQNNGFTFEIKDVTRDTIFVAAHHVSTPVTSVLILNGEMDGSFFLSGYQGHAGIYRDDTVHVDWYNPNEYSCVYKPVSVQNGHLLVKVHVY